MNRVPERRTPVKNRKNESRKRSLSGSPISPRIEDLSKQELLLKLKQSLRDNEKLTDKIQTLEKEIVSIKIAFADKEYEKRSATEYSAIRSYADAAKPSYHKAVLVAKMNEVGAENNMINGGTIENLLQSDKGGPLVQHVAVREHKMVMTFNSDKDREDARAILESKPEFSSAVDSLTAPTRTFPVVALYTGTDKIEELKQEIEHRNQILTSGIVAIRSLSKKSKHVKIFLSSKERQEAILQKGRIYMKRNDEFSSHRIVEVDLNREVRRCYRCQQYGHLIKDCRATVDVYGKCSEAHKTSECDKQNPKFFRCSNCKRRPEHLRPLSDGKHSAGDNFCPEQMKALARYKKTYGL